MARKPAKAAEPESAAVDAAAVARLLDDSAEFDPAGDFDAFALSVPAKPAVCLLVAGDGRPVQLLSVRDLRYCVRRRLGPPEADAPPSRRVDYRQVVRSVRWRRVDSAFEADVAYLLAARAAFPQTYRATAGLRPAWFVHVNPETTFPRYTKTNDLSFSTGTYFGPLETRTDAAKLVELVEDAFDLCRFYSILVQAPDGPACAYKEMGKCPAPCDGSISMDSYREAVRWSAESLADPAGPLASVRADVDQRMRDAASALAFESAGRAKKYAAELAAIGDRKYRHVRPVGAFRFVAVQPGPREGTAKVFVVTPGGVSEVAGLIGDPGRGASELLREILAAGADDGGDRDAELIGVVSQHLFGAKPAGAFLRLDEVRERSLGAAYRELLQRPSVATADGGEGVEKELEAP